MFPLIIRLARRRRHEKTTCLRCYGAYAIVSLSLPEYPDEEVMSSLAFDECMARFEPFVGRDYESSALDIFSMYPTVESWAADDREVVCAVYDMEGQKLEGSVKNLGM